MKQIITITLLCLSTTFTFAQKNAVDLITVKLRNASLLPKKVTVIAYQPGESGNSANGFFLMPCSEKKLQFKEGTKIYVANTQQVGTVMSGKRIDGGTPFLTVRKEDNDKTFKL
jgi:hypothetical protein